MNISSPLRGLRTDLPARGTRRSGINRLVVGFVRQGVLGYAAALAASWYLVDRLGLSESWASAVVLVHRHTG